MPRLFRSLKQAYRDRQRNLAKGIALIDELNQPYRYGSYCSLDDRSIRYTAAWEELFSKKEWRTVQASHDGKCSCCGSSVELDVTVCNRCHAVWNEPSDRLKESSLFRFGFAAVAASATIGYLSGEFFAYLMNNNICVEHGINSCNEEFIGLVESYILVSVPILFLLLSTYIYERMGFAPKGNWMQPAYSQKPENNGIALSPTQPR